MTHNLPDYREDCFHFRGDIPCAPHKQHGVHCSDCAYFTAGRDAILIIKLGATGDVIRTTPLLRRLEREFPGRRVFWLTHSPEVLPDTVTALLPNALSLEILRATRFEAVINLDKDLEACALAAGLAAGATYGFTLRNGKPAPCNDMALPKFLRGIFDDVSQANTESYPQEIFAICGWEFAGEEYVLPTVPDVQIPALHTGGVVVGLNTGCGERWTSRLWATERWAELITRIQAAGLTPLLLGGRHELARNQELQHLTGAALAEPAPLGAFFGVMNNCHVVVTGVTMGLHIAVGLKKRVVLMNNIFNPQEFDLYGRGEIVSPDRTCTCYYRPTCRNEEYRCMEHLPADVVFQAVERQAAHISR